MEYGNETNLPTELPDLLAHIFTGSGEPDTETESTQENGEIALIVFRIIVCILGVLGNALVIFVIVVLREHKKDVTYWYLLQLAIADSLFLLTIPFKVAEDVHHEWIFSGGMCKAKEAILFLNYYSSILFLTAISVDRYVAVCHTPSERLQKLRTNFYAYTITAVVWIASACLCSPVLKYSDKSGIDPYCKCQYEFRKDTLTPEEKCKNDGLSDGDALERCLALSVNGGRCRKFDMEAYIPDLARDFDYSAAAEEGGYLNEYEADSGDYYREKSYHKMGCSYPLESAGWSAVILFNFIVMFAVPFVVMFVCYISIVFRMRQIQRRGSTLANNRIANTSSALSNHGMKRQKSAASARAERIRIRVTFVCLILVLLFLVCWLPFHTVHLAKMRGIVGSTKFCSQLSVAASLLAYLNSAVNPYVCNFVGTKFFRRLRSAAGLVRTSLGKRTSSLSSCGVRVRKKSRKNTATTTKGPMAAREI